MQYYKLENIECNIESYNKLVDTLANVILQPKDTREFGRYLIERRDRIVELKSILIRVLYGIDNNLTFNEVLSKHLCFLNSPMMTFKKIDEED